MSDNSDVQEFMTKMNSIVWNDDVAQFRIKLMLEELQEFQDALIANDDEGMVDALIDLAYVAHGTAIAKGYDWERHWNEVHKKNMEKVVGTTRRGFYLDAVKPEGWTPPDHKRILNESRL